MRPSRILKNVKLIRRMRKQSILERSSPDEKRSCANAFPLGDALQLMGHNLQAILRQGKAFGKLGGAAAEIPVDELRGKRRCDPHAGPLMAPYGAT
jgi:hypothetical protein